MATVGSRGGDTVCRRIKKFICDRISTPPLFYCMPVNIRQFIVRGKMIGNFSPYKPTLRIFVLVSFPPQSWLVPSHQTPRSMGESIKQDLGTLLHIVTHDYD